MECYNTQSDYNGSSLSLSLSLWICELADTSGGTTMAFTTMGLQLVCTVQQPIANNHQRWVGEGKARLRLEEGMEGRRVVVFGGTKA